jgi:hypothetical protein
MHTNICKLVNERPTKCIQMTIHYYIISLVQFRRIKSTILREPSVVVFQCHHMSVMDFVVSLLVVAEV